MEKMQKIKKTIRNLIVFILLIFITFYIVFKDQNIDDMYIALQNVKMQYILIAIIAMILYLTFEALNLYRTLRKLNVNVKFSKALKYAYVGFFFSAITPAASGGQPMQVYYMYKDDIKVGNSTLALLINLCSFQLITIPLALICLIFNYEYLNIAMRWLFVIGIFLNSCALALLLIGIFSKRLSAWLINITIKILKKIKVKNIEQKQEKFERELSTYHESAKYIKANKLLIIKTLSTTLIQILIYYSIPYWVYLSFGLNTMNIIQIISLQAILYATVSGIPLPGAVGVSEGGFLGIFKNVFSAEKVGSAMLINRGVSFYLFVLISGILVLANMFKSNKNKEIIKEENEKEEVNNE